MRALFFVAALAGCHFGIPAVELEMGAAVDGGDDALDANVDFTIPPIDANLFDFSVAVDLHRVVPDGALPGKPGFPCSQANECDNGFCIDGYCCDDLCDPFDPVNKCRACNVPGNEGHCTLAQDGTDPRGLCDEEPVSMCGQDGLCDGKGGCRKRSAGTVCAAASCTGGTLTAPSTCNGLGACIPGASSAPCAPYACNAGGDACANSCTPSTGCAPGATCDVSGRCDGKLGLGQTCFSPNDCQSGFCQQGVCCATDCSGPCRSCNVGGSKGLCTLFAAGSDPLDQCVADTRASCGQDGQCDGSGACRKWSSTTQCAARVCNGDGTVAPRFCDGNGTCLPGSFASCAPYTCETATGVCYGSCASTAQCSAGNKCKVGKGTCGP